MNYWRIQWNNKIFIVADCDAIKFINDHPGCSVQFISIQGDRDDKGTAVLRPPEVEKTPPNFGKSA